MKVEATESGRLILRNSAGVIQHITPPNVYMHLHQRNNDAILISTSADSQNEDESIVILANEVVDDEGNPFEGSRADLMEEFAVMFGYSNNDDGSGGRDGDVSDG